MLEKERKKGREREGEKEKEREKDKRKDRKTERRKEGKMEGRKDGKEGIKHATLLVVSKLLSLGNVLQKSLELKPTASIIIVKLCKHIILVKIVWRWGSASWSGLLEYKPC